MHRQTSYTNRLTVPSDSAEGILILEGARVSVKSRSKVITRALSADIAAADLIIEGGTTVTVGDEQFRAPDAHALNEFMNAVRGTPTVTPDNVGIPPEFLASLGDGTQRWQYAVVNVGMFNSPERMTRVLDQAGAVGWELVTVYDKTSNWWTTMEKGFLLMKRAVPENVQPVSWCILIRG